MERWEENYLRIAEKAGTDYEINDFLLKEILLKMYWVGSAKCKRSYDEEINERLLVRNINTGNYGIYFISYCIEGSPPKGTIFVFHPESQGMTSVFYFDRGRMRDLTRNKSYRNLVKIFVEDALKEMKNE